MSCTIHCRLILMGLGIGLFLAPSIQSAPAVNKDPKSFLKDFKRPSSPAPFSKDNKPNPARIELGKSLFFDPRLSRTQTVSCASCHNPSMEWTDPLPKARGVHGKVLTRRTPTLLNIAWASAFFWDGRAGSLEEQALGPLTSKDEMDMPIDLMITTLGNIEGYKNLFEKAYPGEPLSPQVIAKALANYQSTIVSGQAPFDRWVKGRDDSISPAAKRGFLLFNTKANCVLCHSGWRFTDDSFHDIGTVTDDKGRGVHFPDFDTMQFAFKTPTLRNVSRRAPYLHNGSESTLRDVIELYRVGGRQKRPSLSPLITPLELTDQDVDDLVDFLKTLTSDDPLTTVPRLP